jgi:hypothetical protein
MPIRIVCILLALAMLGAACKKNEPTKPLENEIPGDIARITGSVQGTDGTPLTNVALHLAYDFPISLQQTAEPATPSNAMLVCNEVLTTTCGGQTPLADGISVQIYWDQNSNGPDLSDPQPPLCNDPPDCASHQPFRSVNFTEMPINGAALEIGAGKFRSGRNFNTIGDILSPNRFYARILCDDGSILYESNVLDIHSGPGTYELHFTCTPCSSVPAIPAWSLEQSYPNPAQDSVKIRFGLETAATAAITLRAYGSSQVDTLLHRFFPSGGQRFAFAFGSRRPNGLYTIRYSAGSYSAEVLELRNEDNSERLAGIDPIVRTGSSGVFTLDAPAGLTIAARDPNNINDGTQALTFVRLFAIKAGYVTKDTIFSVAGGQSYEIPLILRVP